MCIRDRLSLGRGFPPLDTGVKARRLYTPHRRCRPVPAQWALPLDPSSALPPLHPATEGSPPSVLPHRRSWLPPQKRLPPVSPAPHPHIYAFRLEVDTEYACGDCRSKHQVQPRHFDRNLPDFRLFFLPPLPPESHALLQMCIRDSRYANNQYAKDDFAYPTTGKMPEKADEIALDTLTIERLGWLLYTSRCV